MQRFFTVAWLVHVPLLGAWALAIFFAPDLWTRRFGADVPTSGRSVFTSTLQLTVGPAVGLLLAAVYAMMRESPAARRRIARALAAAFLAFALVDRLWPPTLASAFGAAEVYPACERALRGVVYALAGFNALAAFWPVDAPGDRQLSGCADTKPPSLWLRWTIQSLLLTAAGVTMLVQGGELLHAGLLDAPTFRVDPGGGLVPTSLDKLRFYDWGEVWMRRAGALWLGLGVLAVAGIPEVKVPGWRGFRAVHMASMAVMALTTLTAFNAAVWRTSSLLIVALPVFLLALNVAAAREALDAPAEETGEAPDGWTFMDLVIGPLIALRVLLSRRRGTHGLGVAARGHWEPMAQRPDGVPEHPWFFPERPFDGPTECVVRFANVTFGDDAGMDVRGAALRIDPPGETRADFLMNTGSCGPINHLVDFALLVFSKFLPRPLVVAAVKRNRHGREGGIAGLRRAPDSYALLHYYGQSTRYWLTSDDTRWLVRYRLVPAAADAKESGVPTRADDLTSWSRARLPDERRARDYLRQELKERLEHTQVAMRLEAQFHLPVHGDGLAWYNGMYDWPRDTHPWRPLGTAVLTTALSDAEAEQLYFDPSYLPPSLGVPASSGPFDPRSPADSERRVIARTQRIRAWLYEELGLPAFGARARGE